VRSSRRLETEAGRNLEVIWLLCGLRPDFKTIADFRKDNRNAFKAVFRQFVLLCRKLDLFGRELVAVDGTRLKAVNSSDRNFTREKLKKLIQWADERLADYLARLDRADGTDDAASSTPATNLAEKIALLKERRGWRAGGYRGAQRAPGARRLGAAASARRRRRREPAGNHGAGAVAGLHVQGPTRHRCMTC
jgi:Transposase domain (DUF772)